MDISYPMPDENEYRTIFNSYTLSKFNGAEYERHSFLVLLLYIYITSVPCNMLEAGTKCTKNIPDHEQ